MRRETKERIWTEVVSQLNRSQTGGKNFALRFDQFGQPYIVIFNGHHWRLPDHVVAQLTGEAHAAIEAAKQKAQRESERIAAELKADREALNARLDEPGFTLLAGEETDVVCRGTLRECRESLWKVSRLPRDPYSGRGCWIIVDSDHHEVQSGYFDKDMAW